MQPRICNFFDLELGDIFKALDSQTYVKTGGGYYSPIGADYDIVPKGGPIFPVCHIDHIEVIPLEKIPYTGYKVPFQLLGIGFYFLQPQCSDWEVYYKVDKENYVYALRNLVHPDLSPIMYKKWSNLDVIFIHDQPLIDEIDSRTWLKKQQTS